MARPISDDREKQFMKLSKEALVRFLFDEFEKNEKLKDKIEFLTQCLDDRDKSIEIMKHKNELQEKALIRLCLKHHYDSIIIEGEEVIDMSNYKVVEKKNPKEEKLF